MKALEIPYIEGICLKIKIFIKFVQVVFVYTGPRMSHDNKLEITKETVSDAKDSHPFLPSVIGLAVKCLIEKATTAEVRRYNSEMEVGYSRFLID